MQERRNTEILSNVSTYNLSIWEQFVKYSENAIAENKELSDSLNLIRFINSYRTYSSAKALLQKNPDLVSQKEYVEILWNEFDKKSQVEISDIYIEMLHELF